MGRLQDRVALVTGGSSGIGKAIARSLAEEGAHVGVTDIQKTPKLKHESSVMDGLENYPIDSYFVEGDVGDKQSVEKIVDEFISEFGKLDILINNAGIYRRYPVHETPVDEWDEIVDTNLRGTFLTSKYALPHLMNSDNAKIINISSVSGLVGSQEGAAYCASKGGITNLTRQMALDYADEEININAIAPGVTKTAQNEDVRSDPELLDKWENETPWPRFAEPEDIAGTAVFLASDESEYITGEVIAVDGGQTAQ